MQLQIEDVSKKWVLDKIELFNFKTFFIKYFCFKIQSFKIDSKFKIKNLKFFYSFCILRFAF
jgi:hypothetical protein